jgi:hypothetical protein
MQNPIIKITFYLCFSNHQFPTVGSYGLYLCSELPSPSSRTMTLAFTQVLTGIITRNLSGGGGGSRPANKADNHTTICETIF